MGCEAEMEGDTCVWTVGRTLRPGGGGTTDWGACDGCDICGCAVELANGSNEPLKAGDCRPFPLRDAAEALDANFGSILKLKL